MSTAQFAAAYLRLRLALVLISTGSKVPQGNAWQQSPITTFAQLNGLPKDCNIGLLHSVSGTCVLDIDHLEYATIALEAVGIDLSGLLNAPDPKIKTPKSLKPLYRLPEGLELKRHALAWKDEHGKSVSILELRAGLTQDLLPPSVHPSGVAYDWVDGLPKSREDIPLLPDGLRTLWQHWHELKPMLEAASPYYVRPPPKPHRKVSGAHTEGRESVIARFNEVTDLRDLLTQHGYQLRARDRFIAPSSSTGTPGVTILQSENGLERCYSHHGSDSLAGEHTHDAFSVYTILEHGGDVSAAVRAAALELGRDRPTAAKPLSRRARVAARMRGWAHG